MQRKASLQGAKNKNECGFGHDPGGPAQAFLFKNAGNLCCVPLTAVASMGGGHA
ncbi:hypothetical protein ILFOPFJJ_01420 [Ensifer psoraleae]|nr:hypothetical protein [Sinorhizobium psoraleae]